MGKTGAIVAFAASLAIYLLTLDPSISWWDCPEYALNAYRLEIGHSPGNPSWTLAANVAAHAGALFGTEKIAYFLNLSSALFSAIAISLFFSIAFFLVRVAFRRSPAGRPLPAMLTALSAALMFAWTDSVWFSAVETEVYALSLLFTAWQIRVMLKYSLHPRSAEGTRQLVLFGYLTGLSIGVHELNLLVIPACALIYLFARRRSPSVGRAWLALLISVIILAFILLVIYPGLPTLAAMTELFAVNSLHLPFNAGALIFLALLLLAFIIILYIPRRRFLKSAAFLILGFSSYLLIPIRGAAQPPVNENDPSDLFSLVGYMKRDQYGSRPLFYGPTPYARPMMREEYDSAGNPVYHHIVRIPKRAVYAPALPGAALSRRSGLLSEEEHAANREMLRLAAKGEERYVLADYRYKPVYTPELNMLFPRLTSHNEGDIRNYESWAGMTKENMTEVECSYALDSLDRPVAKAGADGKRMPEKMFRPTLLQNLQELLGYQIGYMYFRYLLWNFCGRQNDYPSAGEIEHGNVITGINVLDALIEGKNLPPELGRDNRGRNRYFAIPLILGIVGIVALQCRRGFGRRSNAMILTLFLMTGVAIVVYLNQDPGEPRERDYSFLGSFMAFSLWIAAGIAALLNRFLRLRRHSTGMALSAILLLLPPGLMLAVNYDDHDRSLRSGPSDYAANLLNSLDKDAILFLEGDNYTFPVWYAQEVEGIRRDVRVINLSYLSTPRYIVQQMIPGEMSRPVEMTAPREKIAYGAFTFTGVPRDNSPAPAQDAVEALRELYRDTTPNPAFKSPRLRLALPSPEGDDSLTVVLRDLVNGSKQMGMRDLAILDIIATNAASTRPRPIYWQQLVNTSRYGGFKKYTAPALFANKLSPSDTLYLTEESLRMLPRLRFGGADRRGMYADPYVGDQISRQRLALLRLASNLLERNRPKEALRVATLIADKYPDSVWPYQGMVERSGVVWQEGVKLGEILSTAGRRVDDRRATRRGDSLIKAQKQRLAEFRNWKQNLAPWQTSTLSPETKRLFINRK